MENQDEPTVEELEFCINGIYGTLYEEQDMIQDYHSRHGTESALILTIATLSAANVEAAAIREKIEGKVVIEVGAGVALLGIAMAKYAKQVYAIEIDPAWSWGFVRHLYMRKPQNLTFIFGRAQEMVGILRGDVAVVRTRSARDQMKELAQKFAPEVLEL